MKKYEEFINEVNDSETEDKISNVTWPFYGALNLFDLYLRQELPKQGLGKSHIKHDSMSYHSKINDGKVQLAYDIEIGTQTLQEVNMDIPDYFMKLREFFKPFGYVKMEKGDSTAYYYIFLDFDTLIGNEDFWKIVIDKHEWRKSKGHKIDDIHTPKYPDWIKEKPYFKSRLGMLKYNI